VPSVSAADPEGTARGPDEAIVEEALAAAASTPAGEARAAPRRFQAGKWSMGLSLFVWGVFVMLTVTASISPRPAEGKLMTPLEAAAALFILGGPLLCVTGIVLGIRSLRRDEERRAAPILGIVLHALCLVALLSMILSGVK